MSTALITVIKIIGLFLLASLASEILVGATTGQTQNSTIELIETVIVTLVEGIVSVIATIPIIIVNFGIALINGILGTDIDYLDYP